MMNLSDVYKNHSFKQEVTKQILFLTQNRKQLTYEKISIALANPNWNGSRGPFWAWNDPMGQRRNS
jgi:hypothetical protein